MSVRNQLIMRFHSFTMSLKINKIVLGKDLRRSVNCTFTKNIAKNGFMIFFASTQKEVWKTKRRDRINRFIFRVLIPVHKISRKKKEQRFFSFVRSSCVYVCVWVWTNIKYLPLEFSFAFHFLWNRLMEEKKKWLLIALHAAAQENWFSQLTHAKGFDRHYLETWLFFLSKNSTHLVLSVNSLYSDVNVSRFRFWEIFKNWFFFV